MRALLVAAILLSCVSASWAASATLPGPELASAATSFVERQLSLGTGAAASVYNVPDRSIPAGRLALSARWAQQAPPAGFQGRVPIAVGIRVNGQLVRDVTVLVQVGSGATTSAPLVPSAAGAAGRPQTAVRSGDLVTVTFKSESGLKIQMAGTVQQGGNVGDRVRITVRNPNRTLVGRVASDREVVYEPLP